MPSIKSGSSAPLAALDSFVVVVVVVVVAVVGGRDCIFPLVSSNVTHQGDSISFHFFKDLMRIISGIFLGYYEDFNWDF